MKKFRLFSAVKSVVFVLFLSTIIVSCSNSVDSDDDDHEEHSEPFGVALILNGVEIAVQEDGSVSYASGDHIDIPAGDETDLMTIRFVAEDGDRFEPHTDEGYSLDWLISNEDALEVEQHEEDGAWQFHLVGKSVGSSEIQFSLMHNDHSDFTSMPFVVEVHE